MKDKLQIFYDGHCRVCDWEVRKYLKLDSRSRLSGVDISSPEFSAKEHGLDASEVRKVFHVRTPDGHLLKGVDAFVAIWRTLDTPHLKLMASAARLKAVRYAMDRGYRAFIQLRPYLPRKADECQVCVEHKER